MQESILAKLEMTENCIELRTVSRTHGKSQRFLIYRNAFADWCESGCQGRHCECDIYSFIEIGLRDDDAFGLHITWLRGSDAALQGRREYIRLPKQQVMDFLRAAAEGDTLRLLYRPAQARATFDFSHAQRSLHDCLSDPRKRRALSKALRSVGWQDTRFTMYNDGKIGFGFQTDEKCPVAGGLILHEGTRKSNSSEFPYVYYSIHT